MAGLTTTALILGGVALAGTAGALVSADASRDAAREQRRALQAAREDTELGFQRATDLQQPFLESGTQSFNQLSDIVQQQAAAGAPQFSFGKEDIQNDPGIQFAQEQARKSIEASAAARGGALGGGTLQELQNRAVGLSGLQSNQAFQRKLGTFQQNAAGNQQVISNLANVAQVGPQTVGALANQAIGHAGRTGDLSIQTGNVNAAERIGQANAINQGIGGTSNTIQDLIMFQTLVGGGTK